MVRVNKDIAREYDIRTNEFIYFFRGVEAARIEAMALSTSDYEWVDRQLRIEAKMPRRMEESRLWC